MSIAKIDQLKTSIDSKIRSLKLVDNINQSNSVAANKQHFFFFFFGGGGGGGGGGAHILL